MGTYKKQNNKPNYVSIQFLISNIIDVDILNALWLRYYNCMNYNFTTQSVIILISPSISVKYCYNSVILIAV